jgi:UDP-glucose 4-epimerase
VLRLANVYGPRQDPTGEGAVVPVFCTRALAGEPPVIYGDGNQTRDYVYVGDVVQAFLALATAGRPGTWHIGTGTEVSVRDLAAIVAGIAGHPAVPRFAPPRAGELRRSALATGKAARDLGWRPLTALPDGLRAVCDWLRAGAPDRAGL